MHLFRTIQVAKKEKVNDKTYHEKFEKFITKQRMQSCFDYRPSGREKNTVLHLKLICKVGIFHLSFFCIFYTLEDLYFQGTYS